MKKSEAKKYIPKAEKFDILSLVFPVTSCGQLVIKTKPNKLKLVFWLLLSLLMIM